MMHPTPAPHPRYAAAQTPGGGARQAPGEFPAAALDTRVLVIEDEAMIAWMVQSLFEDMGFGAIALAASGAEAIATARVFRPGLIVSDVNLGPGIDGIAAAAAIQEEDTAPVIFITGYGIADATERVAGVFPAAPILRKPVQTGELRAAVLAALIPPRPH